MKDLIDRQAAIDAVDNYIGTFDAIDVNFLDGLKTAKKLMMQLPSAQPERKKGKWIDGYKRQICSVCKQRRYRSWNFCPNCGARME